jgi:hypothetical protein
MMAGKLIFNCVDMHNGMMSAKSKSNVNFTKNMTNTKIIYFSTSWKEPKIDYVGKEDGTKPGAEIIYTLSMEGMQVFATLGKAKSFHMHCRFSCL